MVAQGWASAQEVNIDPKLLEIQKLLDAADGNLSSARAMMREMSGIEVAPLNMDKQLQGLTDTSTEKEIEGVFEGEMMIAADGKTYPVPPNYASKSKLVEGDTLKLTIADDGSFIFKQIAPTERRNAIGTLALDGGNYTISAEGKNYKVLTASVTFYKAEPGDQVTIILPKEHDAVYAVLENVIKKANTEPVDVEPVVMPEVSKTFTEELVIPVPPETTPTTIDTVEEVLQEGLNVSVSATAAVSEPEIEFPAGTSTMSDEQLLENLKNNLKTLDQPAFTPSENVTASSVSSETKQVDNIVANDMAQLDNKQQTINNQQQAGDNPIAELDI
jgi:hypothetical protein